MGDYRDEHFEWDEEKSADRFTRSGFDFHAAKTIFESNRYVERWDGLLGPVVISVVYTERPPRKRITSAFRADVRDILEYMVTYAIIEEE